MVRGDAVKGIEFGHLIVRDELADQGIGIEFQLPQVDVHPLDDSVE
jgi:hypothetical protein